MLMQDPKAFDVFAKWRKAPANAFGSKNNPGVIKSKDKERYSLIFNELMQAAEKARLNLDEPNTIQLKSMNFSHQYGSRGHRPVDVWVSLCGTESENFARMPQVYMIASERGLELGFAISINEDDYHDSIVKSRNRTIVPLINRKLPNPTDDTTISLAGELNKKDGWVFNTKARLAPGEDGYAAWASFSEMIEAIKSSGNRKGGGSVCKIFTIDELADIDLDTTFSNAMQMFHPLLMRCLPNAWDRESLTTQAALDDLEGKVTFDPANIEDARERVLREIAQRRGQGKFRRSLLKAYNGKCLISQTALESVLEAAHITPYLGDKTNHISNGLLLRADIHTLFDLKLIKIDPKTMRVKVATNLEASPYWKYNNLKISMPDRKKDRPSKLALAKHFMLD